MSEPNPNPLSPNPFQETDRPQPDRNLDGQKSPDPNLDGQKSPDPVLESGSFIHVVQNGDAETTVPMDREPESAAAPPEASGAEYVTPLSQRRPMEMLQERPDWLPEGWRTEVRIRTSGVTAGTTDRYYIAPSGQKLRSKKEVLHFLETGSKRKRKLKSDAGTTPSENTSDRPQKINKTNIRNFSDIHFDFKSPPQSVTWVQTDDVKDEWVPAVGNTTVPESQKSEWGSVFSRVIKLDRTNSAA